jgi:5-methyltetrahydropteroyltriglutamate--homocysteine methyltransferase
MTICVHPVAAIKVTARPAAADEPVAERLLQNTDVDGFLLEYDTERAGDFSPLRYLPKSRMAVLGIISTKLPELEPVDEIRRRIDEASRYADFDQLCLSPQCGFASSYMTDRLASDDQERKLAHLVKVAHEVWG